jgi:hypothetical protein
VPCGHCPWASGVRSRSTPGPHDGNAYAARDESFEEDRPPAPISDAAYRLARWLLRNDHDAEDAVQDASLRLPVLSHVQPAETAARGFSNRGATLCTGGAGSMHTPAESFDEQTHVRQPIDCRIPERLVLQNRPLR